LSNVADRPLARMIRPLLRDRAFRLLLAGQTLTMFGDVALLLVLGIWATELTGSTSVGGAVFLAVLLPMLVAPLLGMLVDRFPRRHVMIVNDLVMAAALLPLLLVDGPGDVWILFAVGAAYGLSQQVFFAARSALLRSMLHDDQLGSANAVLEGLRQALRVGGPALGALLFTVLGGGAVALLDAATFLGSAALLSVLRVPDIERGRPRGERSVATELAAGIRHILATPDLRRMLFALCAAVGVLGVLQVAGLALVVSGLHRPITFLGVVVAFEGLGSIGGGLLAPVLLRRAGELRLAAIGLLAMALGVGIMAMPLLAPVLVGAAVGGAGFSFFLVGYTTLLQRSTSSELQGRVFTAAEAAAGIPYCAMLGLAAIGIALVDYRLLMLANTLVLALAGLYLGGAGWVGPSPVALARRVSPR
jgi:MFS family permease